MVSAISAGKILHDIKAKNTRLRRRIHCEKRTSEGSNPLWISCRFALAR